VSCSRLDPTREHLQILTANMHPGFVVAWSHSGDLPVDGFPVARDEELERRAVHRRLDQFRVWVHVRGQYLDARAPRPWLLGSHPRVSRQNVTKRQQSSPDCRHCMFAVSIWRCSRVGSSRLQLTSILPHRLTVFVKSRARYAVAVYARPQRPSLLARRVRSADGALCRLDATRRASRLGLWGRAYTATAYRARDLAAGERWRGPVSAQEQHDDERGGPVEGDEVAMQTREVRIFLRNRLG
jgi:hypothetical protein